MRVLVTGGTGYLGAHAVRTLVHHGHDVRLLVRAPSRVAQVLGPLGVEPPPHVVGAVSDSFGSILRAGAMPLGDARVSYVDVRDVAEAHHRALVPGLGPRRYVIGGHTLDGPAIAAVLREVTGRRLPVLPIPGVVWRGLGRAVDLGARILPFDPVFTHEAMVLSTQWEGTDDRATRAGLGVEYRAVEQTFRQAVEGLVRTGGLSRRSAGRAGEGVAA